MGASDGQAASAVSGSGGLCPTEPIAGGFGRGRVGAPTLSPPIQIDEQIGLPGRPHAVGVDAPRPQRVVDVLRRGR